MKKVLVIYNSFSFGREILPALINAGFEISTISGEGNVLVALHRDSYDLLVVDTDHPEEKSTCLLSDIRKTSGYRSTPIIFTSDKSKMHCHGDYPVPKSVHYLRKPFQPDQFLSALTITTMKERESFTTSAGSQ